MAATNTTNFNVTTAINYLTFAANTWSSSTTATGSVVINGTCTDLTIAGSPTGIILSRGTIQTLPARAPTTPPTPIQAAPPRGFNRFLSASDLLAAFAKFAEREARLGRTEFLELPLKYFVQWLVLESASHDGEDPPEGIDPAVRIPKWHRCRACGRFMPKTYRSLGIFHCNPAHMQLSLARAA